MKKMDSSSWSEIKSLDERLKREPDSFCFARLSEIYLKVGLLADALHTARQGVSRHPGYLAGQRALAMACNANGLPEESRALLEKVTAAMPEDTVAQKLLARLYVDCGDKVSAIRTYATLLDFSPDDAQSRARLEELQRAVADEPFQGTQSFESVSLGDAVVEGQEEDIYELSEEDIVYDDAEDLPGMGAGLVEAPSSEVAAQVHHDPLSTLTLAELYEKQGFVAKALDIYRAIREDDPANKELQDKIDILERQVSASQAMPEQYASSDLDDGQETVATAALGNISAPLDPQVFSSLAYQTADNVLGTLESWLENIRRIKACR
ncbi:MAG: hypothetical protein M0023_03795 [Desulfobacteraceae bacterium]|nr:hypothetical protein [Desulfobacteraceae bacterium]